jgi:tetratricopeptide (TPR) repeat protein
MTAGDSRAQNNDSEADDIFQKALMAEYSEFWERAIDLFKEGGVKFPQDIRFPRALGRLYYSRSLYGLAWDEYRKAELINPYDAYILHRLANTAGCLNQDRTSVAYLEKVLCSIPITARQSVIWDGCIIRYTGLRTVSACWFRRSIVSAMTLILP